MARFYFLLSVFFLPFVCPAQFITHGPVIGGLKPDGARMYVRTDTVRSFLLLLSTDPQMTTTLNFMATTVAKRDTSVIVSINGLQSETKYYYQLVFNGNIDQRSGSFTTFPPHGKEGRYTFVTGSCQETSNMKVFDVIPQHHPDLFLHTGDFTYPSFQLDNTYPSNYETVQLSWQKRYEEKKMETMLLDLPIDYIPDDDDLFGSSRTFTVSPENFKDSTGTIVNFFDKDSITPQMRRNVWRGYAENFPGYELEDTTDGLYHSFTMGNCEFFFVDSRSAKDPVSEAFDFDSAANNWRFAPDSNHSILGDQQMNWLMNELGQSTADWKFIVGGLAFNKSIRRIIDVGMGLQNFEFTVAGRTGTGMRLAASFAHYWAGYPDDQRELLNYLQSNNMKNVIFVSGDTHHNVMDDGTNSGIPELNASGLSVATTELAFQVDSVGNILGQPPVEDSLWNQGGNGVGNRNFNNAFGKIEVFGDDSVQLCVIDENNTTLSCFTIQNPRFVGTEEPDTKEATFIANLFPNPAREKLLIRLNEEAIQEQLLSNAYVTNLKGEMILEINSKNLQSRDIELDIASLSIGQYNLIVTAKDGRQETKKFVVQR